MNMNLARKQEKLVEQLDQLIVQRELWPFPGIYDSIHIAFSHIYVFSFYCSHSVALKCRAVNKVRINAASFLTFDIICNLNFKNTHSLHFSFTYLLVVAVFISVCCGHRKISRKF